MMFNGFVCDWLVGNRIDNSAERNKLRYRLQWACDWGGLCSICEQGKCREGSEETHGKDRTQVGLVLSWLEGGKLGGGLNRINFRNPPAILILLFIRIIYI